MTHNHNLTHRTFQLSQTLKLHHYVMYIANSLPQSFEPTNIEPTNNPTEQMEINNTVSESSDNNDVPSQNRKASDQSISTPPPSKRKYDIKKRSCLSYFPSISATHLSKRFDFNTNGYLSHTKSLKRQFHLQMSTYITVYAPWRLRLQTL